MDLLKPAEAERERRTRSKLEPHREAIFALRRKHWTYGQIAEWLKKHGIAITLSSVHRFCERAVARRPRPGNETQPLENIPFSIPQATTRQITAEPRKHKFNLDI